MKNFGSHEWKRDSRNLLNAAKILNPLLTPPEVVRLPSALLFKRSRDDSSDVVVSYSPFQPSLQN